MSHHHKHHHHFNHHEQNHKKRDRKHDKSAATDLQAKIRDLLANHKYEEPPKTADEAWAKLVAGNARFTKGDLSEYLLHLAHEVSPERRQELGLGQHPFAVVLTCSDSRVAPELIFDQGLGDLFVVRTAGNVPDPVALGSIEYGLLHLKAPLLVVLGHTKCGAVTATLDYCKSTKGTPHEHHEEDKSHIGCIVKEIKSSAEKAEAKYGSQAGKEGGDLVLRRAVRGNVRSVAKNLPLLSSPIRDLIEKGEVGVRRAVYDIDTGKVELVQRRHLHS